MSDQTEHLVKSFDGELKRLRAMITEMGGIVETQMTLATQAILQRDASAATRAVEEDTKVDALEREIEQFVIRMLALRQPVASDLRHIVAALRITGDLERIGDHAANAAKRSIVLSQHPVGFPLSGLSHMLQLAQSQVKDIIDAISENDAQKAIAVWKADSRLDEVYNTLFREFITYMMEDPRTITSCAHLLFIAKNMERVGDHTTNIAEVLHYAVTGQLLTDPRPKSDNSPYAVVRPKEDNKG